MGRSDPQDAGVYQLRVVLRGISPMIWRRLQVRSDSTLADLHDVLQLSFGWEDMHLHCFEIRGREYGIYRDGGPLLRDARKVLLCDLKLRRQERFTYQYDFGDNWIHDLRIEAMLPIDAGKIYPCCLDGKRAGPPEDCGGPYNFMENRWQYELIGGGDSREELEDLVDDLEDEDWEILREYHPEQFDRARLNRALARLASGSMQEARDEIDDPGSD